MEKNKMSHEGKSWNQRQLKSLKSEITWMIYIPERLAYTFLTDSKKKFYPMKSIGEAYRKIQVQEPHKWDRGH